MPAATRHPRSFLALGLALGLAVPAAAADFRSFDWGAPRAAIRKAERLPLHHDLPDEVAYWSFELAGVPAGLIYELRDGHLVSAYYMSRHTTPDPKEDLADYRAFQEHFDQQYGERLSEEWVRAEGSDAADEAGSLDALTAGRVTLVTTWSYGRTDVRLEMVGGDGAVQTIRAYHSPKQP